MLNSIPPKQFYGWKQIASPFQKLQRKLLIDCISQYRLGYTVITNIPVNSWSSLEPKLWGSFVFRVLIRSLWWTTVQGREKKKGLGRRKSQADLRAPSHWSSSSLGWHRSCLFHHRVYPLKNTHIPGLLILTFTFCCGSSVLLTLLSMGYICHLSRNHLFSSQLF